MPAQGVEADGGAGSDQHENKNQAHEHLRPTPTPLGPSFRQTAIGDAAQRLIAKMASEICRQLARPAANLLYV